MMNTHDVVEPCGADGAAPPVLQGMVQGTARLYARSPGIGLMMLSAAQGAQRSC